MKAIVILGGGPLQQPAYVCAKESSWYSICVDGAPDPVCKELSDEFWHIDLKDYKSISDRIIQSRSLMPASIEAVFTLATDFSHAVSYIAEACKLPGIPYANIMAAKDKGIMREALKKAGVGVPDFIVSTEYNNEVVQFMASRRECVVKPCDSMGARGVQLVNGASKDAFAEAHDHSSGGRVIVEDLIQGREYSIDSLVWDNDIRICGIADRHIHFSPRFVELGHSLPAKLDDVTRDRLCSEFKRAVKALGITRGVAKGDVFISPEGKIVVGEIAARLSGGFMSGWTYPAASGINLTECAMKIAFGQNPIPYMTDELSNAAVERSIVSIPGIISEVVVPEDIPASTLAYVQVQPGDKVHLAVNNVNKLAHIISSGHSVENAALEAENLISRFVSKLEPLNKATEAYLFAYNKDDSVYYQHPQLIEYIPKDWCEAVEKTDPLLLTQYGKLQVIKTSGDLDMSFKDWRYRSVSDILSALGHYVKSDPFAKAGLVPGALFWQTCMKGGLEALIWLYESLEAADISIEEQVTIWRDY